MPYQIERSGSQYAVVDDQGKIVGTHPTKGKAAAQVRALYANVPDATKDDVIRYGRRRSGIGDSHSGVNMGGSVASTGGNSMSAADQIIELASVIKQLINEVPGGTPEGTTIKETSTYKDCGCETCKAMQVDCPDCPACSPEIMGNGKDAEMEESKPGMMDAYDNSMGKKDKPNYGAIISERKGKPADGQLYSRVIRAAKDKFDVYPSAVANAWVVAEYKRRGGTYKSDTDKSTTIWDGSIFDSKGFIK